MKEGPRSRGGHYGCGLGPKSAGTLETGKEGALGTCGFASIVSFFKKCIYERSFPVYAGKVFFKLSDKDFGFCKTIDDMNRPCVRADIR